MDPMPITCPKCDHNDAYTVANLLDLKAVCSICGQNFKSDGLKMKENSRLHQLETWPFFFFADEVCEEFNIDLDDITDDEFDNLKTINDIIIIIKKNHSDASNIEKRIMNVDMLKTVKDDLNADTFSYEKLSGLAERCHPKYVEE